MRDRGSNLLHELSHAAPNPRNFDIAFDALAIQGISPDEHA